MRVYRIEPLLDGFASFSQLSERVALLMHKACISLTGGAARSREVWFSHLRVSRASVYAKRFECPVKFGQAFDGIFLSEADYKSKVIAGDPNIFSSELRMILARFPAHSPGVEELVRQAISRALLEEDCTRAQVAASLGMHSRTLQRRLCEIGRSFEAIRDEVRRNLAVRYLARSDLYFTEIACRLGFSEPAVLSRSCRRWFAATPSELRRNLSRFANIRSI
jgi:AraC-like DNA-binding protein